MSCWTLCNLFWDKDFTSLHLSLDSFNDKLVVVFFFKIYYTRINLLITLAHGPQFYPAGLAGWDEVMDPLLYNANASSSLPMVS